MAESDLKKFLRNINRVDDLVGADISRDLIKVAIGELDINQLDSNIKQVGGTAQTGDDWTPLFQELPNLAAALKTNDNDELVTRIAGANGVEVQEEQLDTALSATDVALLTATSKALNDVGQDELVSRLADSTGAQIDPFDESQLGPKTSTTTGTGSANAASVDLGQYIRHFSINFDSSGSSSLTVEVSTDNSSWRSFDSQSFSSANQDIYEYNTAFRYVRAYVDQNINRVEISARGI